MFFLRKWWQLSGDIRLITLPRICLQYCSRYIDCKPDNSNLVLPKWCLHSVATLCSLCKTLYHLRCTWTFTAPGITVCLSSLSFLACFRQSAALPHVTLDGYTPGHSVHLKYLYSWTDDASPNVQYSAADTGYMFMYSVHSLTGGFALPPSGHMTSRSLCIIYVSTPCGMMQIASFCSEDTDTNSWISAREPSLNLISDFDHRRWCCSFCPSQFCLCLSWCMKS